MPNKTQLRLILALWIALQTWILSRFGIST